MITFRSFIQRKYRPVVAALGSMLTFRNVVLPLLFGAILVCTHAQQVHAGPKDGNVVAGDANIVQLNPKLLEIIQGSDKVIIDWRSFSIDWDELVRFLQPDSDSIALNRVNGDTPSYILGQLTADGRVMLINPNGVLFGDSAVVDIGSLVATTIDIRNEDFMAGDYNFDVDRASGGTVVNRGRITAAEGGIVALVAPGVENSGVIVARLGRVALASGNSFALDFYGDRLIQIGVDDSVAERLLAPDGTELKALVDNSGEIYADGGTVMLMAASVAKDVVDHAINMEGIIEARTATERNGQIVLEGAGEGIVRVTGTLDASGRESGDTGGEVKILGSKVGLVGQAEVDVSGDAGGGEVLIGGNFQGRGPERNADFTTIGSEVAIQADALTTGDGGRVIVWSDRVTRFYGNISGRGGRDSGDGGFAEISGKQHLQFAPNSIDLSAPKGLIGELLLDPLDIVISDSDGTDDSVFSGDNVINFNDDSTATYNITPAAFEAIDADITLQALQDITVNSPIDRTGSGDSTLTLQAGRHLIINADITGSIGAHSFIFEADSPGSSSNDDNGTLTIGSGVTITSNNGDITLIGAAFNIDATGSINAGTGDIHVAPSQAVAMTISAATGNLSNAEIGRFTTSGTIYIGTASTGSDGSGGAGSSISASSITVSETLTISGSTSLVLRAGRDITVSSAIDVSGSADSTLALQAGGNLTINADITGSNGAHSFIFEAHSPGLNYAGLGELTIASGVTITSNNGDITLIGDNFDINATGIDAGTGDIHFAPSRAVEMTISIWNILTNTEFSSGTIYIGTATTGPDGSGGAGSTISASSITLVNYDLIIIGSASLVLDSSGTTTLYAGVSTEDGDITFGDPVVLGASVTVVSDTDGDITFTSTVDGGYALTLDAGGGAVELRGAVGGTTKLSGLTVDGGQIDVDAVATTGDIDIDGSTNIALSGATYESDDGDIILAGAGGVTISVSASLVLRAGRDLTVSSAIDVSGSAASTLALQAGRHVIINADITGSSAAHGLIFEADSPGSSNNDGVGTLTIASGVTITSNNGDITLIGAGFDIDATGSINAGTGDIHVAPSQAVAMTISAAAANLSNAEIGRFTTSGTIRIGTATTGPAGSGGTGSSILATSITVSEALTISGSASLVLRAESDITVSSAIDLSGSADSTLALQAGGHLTIDADITGTNGAHGFILEADSPGSSNNDGVGTLTIASGVTITSNNGDITLIGAVFDIDATGSINAGTGDIHVAPSQAVAMTISAAADNLGNAEIGRFTTSGTIRIGTATTGPDGSGGGGSPISASSITVSEALIFSGGASLVLDSGGTTTLRADVSTDDGDITFGDAVILGADVTVDSDADDDVTDGDITFTSTVDGGHALTLDADSGSVTVSGAMGGTTALSGLTVDGGRIDVDAVATTGDIDIDGSTDIALNGAIYESDDGDIILAGAGGVTISGSASLVLWAGRDLTVSSSIDVSGSADSTLTLQADRHVTINADITGSSGAHGFIFEADSPGSSNNDGVGTLTIAGGVTITSNNGDITLIGAAFDIDATGSINAGTGDIHVAPSQAVAMTISAAADNLSNAEIGRFTTSGTIRIGTATTGPDGSGGGGSSISATSITVGEALTISGSASLVLRALSDITVSSSIDLSGSADSTLALQAGRHLTVNADITGTNGAHGFIFEADSPGSSNNDGTGKLTIASGVTITSNNGDITLIGAAFDINATGSINAGTGDIHVAPSRAVAMTISAAADNLGNAEIGRFTTSGTIRIGTATTGPDGSGGGGSSISASGITVSEALTISGSTSLVLDSGGTTTLRADVSTDDGDITFGDAVVLGADVTVYSDTDDAATDGDIIFTSTVDGGQMLTLDADGGAVDLRGAVGGTTKLSGLTVDGGRIDVDAVATTGDIDIDGSTNIALSGAIYESDDGDIILAGAGGVTISGSASPVLRAGRDITVSSSIDVSGSADSTLALQAGRHLTINADITGSNGAHGLILEADSPGSSNNDGVGTLTIASGVTITSNNGDITLIGAGFDIDATGSINAGTGDIHVAPSRAVAMMISAAADNLGNAEIGRFTTSGTIRIGTATTGPDGSGGGGSPISATSITVGEALTISGSASLVLWALSDITVSSAIDVSGSADSTLVLQAGGHVTINADITGTNAAHGLILEADSPGTSNNDGVGTLTIASGVTIISNNGDITLIGAAFDIDATGSIDAGTGDIHVAPSRAVAMTISAAADNLGNAEIGRFTTSGTIRIGTATTGPDDSGGGGSSISATSITVSEALTISGSASLVLDTSGMTTLSADVSTDDGDITFGDAVILGADVMADSDADDDATDGDIIFTSTVDGGHALTLDADSGAVTVSGAMGGTMALASLTVDGGQIDVDAVATTGDIDIDGSTNIALNGAIYESDDGDIILAGAGGVTISGGASLVLRAGRDLTVSSAIDVSGSADSILTLQAGRHLAVNADITGTNGAHGFILEADSPGSSNNDGIGTLTIAGGVTITSNNGDITLIGAAFDISATGSINAGTGDIHVAPSRAVAMTISAAADNLGNAEIGRFTTSGTIRIGTATTGPDGSGGGGSPISATSITVSEALTISGSASLVLDTSGTTTLSADVSTDDGDITFGDAVILGADVTVDSDADDDATDGAITFTSTVDGGHALTLDAGGGAVELRGAVGGTTALASLTVDGGRIDVDAVATTGDIDIDGSTNIDLNGAIYESDDGDITFTGAGDVIISGSASLVLRAGRDLTVSSAIDVSGSADSILALQAGRHLTINADITGTNGAHGFIFEADSPGSSNNDGTGKLTIGSGVTITSNNGDITLIGAAFDIDATGSIDAGTGDIHVAPSQAVAMTISAAVENQGDNLSNTEIGRFTTSGTIRIGTAITGPDGSGGTGSSISTTTITVIDALTISGSTSLVLRALRDIFVFSSIDLSGSAGSTLTLQAGRHLTIAGDITGTNGAHGFIFEADSPGSSSNDGIGKLTIGYNATITSDNGDITLIGAAFEINATSSINAGTGDIYVAPSRAVAMTISTAADNLSNTEIGRFTTSGTIRIGTATTGPDGSGGGGSSISATSITVSEALTISGSTSLVLDSSGTTTLRADVSTEDGDITFGDAVILGADVTVASDADDDATDGDIIFTSMVDGGHALTLDADSGAVELQGAVGGTTKLSGLTVDGGRIDVDAVATTGDIDIDGSTNIALSGATYESDDGDIILAGAGGVTISGSASPVLRAGRDLTVSSSIDVSGSTDSTLTLQAGRHLTINADITGTNGAHGFILEADSPGSSNNDGVGTLTIASGVTITSNNGDITLIGAAFGINATSSINAGAGDIYVAPSRAVAMTISAAADNLGDNLSNTEIGRFTTSGTIRIGTATTGPDGSGGTGSPISATSITVIEALIFSGGASLVLDSSGTTTLRADVSTEDGDITFGDAVTLGADVTVDSDADDDATDGDITFTSMVDGGQMLTLDADGGAVELQGAVGGTTKLSGLTVDGGQIDVDAVATTGDIDIDGSTNIALSGGTYESDDGDIILAGAGGVTISGSVSLVLRAGRDITVSSSIDVSGSADSTLALQAGRHLTINADITGTNGAHGFIFEADSPGSSNNDGVGTLTIASGVTITSNNGDITLIGAGFDIDATGSIDAGTGDIHVAPSQAVAMTISAAADNLGNAEIGRFTTSGTIRIGTATTGPDGSGGGGSPISADSITVSEALTISGSASLVLWALSDITVSSAIDLSGSADSILALQAGDDLTINADITGTDGAHGLILEADSPGSSNNDGVGELTIAGGVTITSNNGDITLIGAGFDIDATGSINAGTGDIHVAPSQAVAMTISAAADILGNKLSNAEIGRFTTTGTIRIGTATTGPDGSGGGGSPISATSITVGEDLTISGGASLVLDSGGTTTLHADVSTDDGDITFNDAVILGADVMADSDADDDATDGAITFTSTVDGGYALTLDADSGAVTVSGAMGGTTALASLTVDGGQIDVDAVATTGDIDIDGSTNIYLSGATYESDDGDIILAGAGGVTISGSASPVLRAGRDLTVSSSIDVSGSADSILTLQAGRHLTINADITGTNGAHGFIFEADSPGLNYEGSGKLTIGSGVTITSNNGDITLIGAAFDIDATSSINAGTGDIHVAPSRAVAMTIRAAADNLRNNLSNAEIGRFTTSGTIHIGTATTGPDGSGGAGSPISASSITVSETLTISGSASLVLRAVSDITVSSAIDLSGSADSTLTLQAGRHLIINADITGTNGAHGLILEADSPGSSNNDGSGKLRFDNNVTITSNNGDITLIAAAFDINATSSIDAGTGDIHVAPSRSVAMTISAAADILGNKLSNAQIGRFTTSGTIRIGTATTGPDGSGGGGSSMSATSITVSEDLTISGSASLVLDSSGTTTLREDVLTDDGDITFGDAVILGADVTVDSDADDDATDGGITFNSTVDGGQMLTLDADSGAVELQGAVGGTAKLSGLTVDGGQIDVDTVATTGDIDISGSMNIDLNGATYESDDGDITFTGAVDLHADVTVDSDADDDATDGDITFTSTVDGGQALTLDADGGAVELQGAVGGTTALTSLTVDGGQIDVDTVATTGDIDISGSTNIDLNGATYESDDGDITFTGTVDLHADVTVDSDADDDTTDGDITFTSTVDGGQALTLDADSGSVTVSGVVGGTTALTSLTVVGGTVSLEDVKTTDAD